jgi:hypothetical protein
VTGLMVPRVRCDDCGRTAEAKRHVGTLTELRSLLRPRGWRSYQQPGWTLRDRCPNCGPTSRATVHDPNGDPR